jgi:hypothetical protein
VNAVVHAPNGAHPSYAAGYTVRDNAFYQAWDPIARDREAFLAWMREHVLEAGDAGDTKDDVRDDVREAKEAEKAGELS